MHLARETAPARVAPTVRKLFVPLARFGIETRDKVFPKLIHAALDFRRAALVLDSGEIAIARVHRAIDAQPKIIADHFHESLSFPCRHSWRQATRRENSRDA